VNTEAKERMCPLAGPISYRSTANSGDIRGWWMELIVDLTDCFRGEYAKRGIGMIIGGPFGILPVMVPVKRR
jgi:hypothetical protein